MKFRVVGWTAYDNPDVPEGESHDAADRAVIDEIAKRGYLFPGSDHHWHQLGAPVLNDGKMRTYSERGWGAIMAEGHGDSFGDYVDYAFDWDIFDDPKDDKRVFPYDNVFDPEGFVPDFVNIEIEHHTKAEVIEAARNPETKEIILEDDPVLMTTLEPGDTLTLVCGEERESFKVSRYYRDTNRRSWGDRELRCKTFPDSEYVIFVTIREDEDDGE